MATLDKPGEAGADTAGLGGAAGTANVTTPRAGDADDNPDAQACVVACPPHPERGGRRSAVGGLTAVCER